LPLIDWYFVAAINKKFLSLVILFLLAVAVSAVAGWLLLPFICFCCYCQHLLCCQYHCYYHQLIMITSIAFLLVINITATLINYCQCLLCCFWCCHHCQLIAALSENFYSLSCYFCILGCCFGHCHCLLHYFLRLLLPLLFLHHRYQFSSVNKFYSGDQ